MVLLAYLFLSSISLAEPDQVAIAARFYYPPGDKRTSYHQIYLCDFRGGNRRQITSGAVERTGVRWVGRNKLAWLESTALTLEDSIGYHCDWSAKIRLVEYDLRSGNSRTVANGYGSVDEQPFARGQAVFFVSDSPGNSQLSTTYAVLNGKLQPVEKVPQALGAHTCPDNDGGCANAWKRLGYDVSTDIEEVDRTNKLPYRDIGWEQEGPSHRIIYKGKSVVIPLQTWDHLFPSKTPDTCWLRAASRAASGGCDEWVYQVNLGSGKARLAITDVLNIDFLGDDGYWAASSNEKSVTDLGKLSVWPRELWAGNALTGQQWRIAAGAVHGSDARIRPRW